MRISQLDLSGPVTASDQIALVQQGRTKRTPLSNLQVLFADGCQCTLVSRYNTTSTGNNTLLTYLQTYTVPEEVMAVDGNWLQIHAAGFFSANGNTKLISIGVKQDSTGHHAQYSIPSFGYNDDYWMIDLRIQRKSQTQYVIHQYMSVTGNAVSLQTPGVLHSVGDVAGVNWDTGDLQITVEATNGTASSGDITNNTFIIIGHLQDPNS